MSEGGDVTRENVLRVLEHALSSEISFDNKGDGSILLVKDGIPEHYPLPPKLGRRFLQRLSGRYGIKIEWFYHPEMVKPK